MHISTYAGLLRTRFSLNILLLTNMGLEESLSSFFSSVHFSYVDTLTDILHGFAEDTVIHQLKEVPSQMRFMGSVSLLGVEVDILF